MLKKKKYQNGVSEWCEVSITGCLRLQMQLLLLHWLHASLDSLCLMQKNTQSKINLWHSKNQISNQIRVWMWLIRRKSRFSISITRKWEVAAACESPRNVTFTLCIQDFQGKKFRWKKFRSHHPLHASVKHRALCLQSSTALQGCVRAVLPGYSQQAQNTLLQTALSATKQLCVAACPFTSCSPKALLTYTSVVLWWAV